ncbi:hypothetical protein ACHAXN_012682 [Cyclotella atomus]
MSSVTLPPLPSMRAKEIVRRQQSLITEILEAQTRDIQTDNSEAKASVDKDTTSSPRETETANPPKSISEVMAARREQRADELQALQQKEQKILGNQSPLDPNLLCEAVHQYICTTSSFINTYVADVNVSLEGVDHKLRVLEDQMSLLEGRLQSIPGLLDDEEDVEVDAVAEDEEPDTNT